MSETSRSDKALLWIRIAMVMLIGVLVFSTVNWINSAGVRAPLLTMMGGATIIMTLYPFRSIAMQDIARDVFTVIGTGIAIAGGFFWLIDAAQEGTVDDFLRSFYLALSLMLLSLIYVVISMLTIADWHGIREAIRKVTRR